MGQDLVAVDATCARVMGLRPERMTFLQMAGEFLGNVEAGSIEQRGERSGAVPDAVSVLAAVRRPQGVVLSHQLFLTATVYFRADRADRPADKGSMASFLSAVSKAPPGTRFELVERSRRAGWSVPDLEVAVDSATRKKGLLGREGLADGGGLVIAPTNAVHTFFMRFPIDIVFVSRAGRS